MTHLPVPALRRTTYLVMAGAAVAVVGPSFAVEG